MSPDIVRYRDVRGVPKQIDVSGVLKTRALCPQQMGPAEKRAIVATADTSIRDVLKPHFLPEIQSSE